MDITLNFVNNAVISIIPENSVYNPAHLLGCTGYPKGDEKRGTFVLQLEKLQMYHSFRHPGAYLYTECRFGTQMYNALGRFNSAE